ncbi:hypothetical protein AB1Y20_000134 [Prymnesium parvum]|uniref:Uncharacterized protein n=1 Tax=Prymnesium parvum TaxID=97485 RepID=A0AB34K502_PRYPA
MAWLAALALLASPAAASRVCSRADVAPTEEGAPWTLAGCTALNLSCAPASRDSACDGGLRAGEIAPLCDALPHAGAELASIDLAGAWLGPHGAALLGRALAAHGAVQTLRLRSCRAGDYGVLALVKELLAAPPPRLEALDLSHNSVGDVGARELSVLLEHDALPSLRHLDLRWNGIGPRGGRYLGAALASSQRLQSLALDWNGLMDRGARALGDGLAENTALQFLSLEHNAIKNEGAKALALGLRRNGALQELRLDANGVSRGVRDEVAAALLAVPEPPQSAASDRPREDPSEIEEISFDDEAEDEAPRPAAGGECRDFGPWECVEQNCPSPSIDCAMLAELGLCETRFDEIWEEAPPQGTAGLHTAEKCRKSCGQCGGRDEL